MQVKVLLLTCVLFTYGCVVLHVISHWSHIVNENEMIYGCTKTLKTGTNFNSQPRSNV